MFAQPVKALGDIYHGYKTTKDDIHSRGVAHSAQLLRHPIDSSEPEIDSGTNINTARLAVTTRLEQVHQSPNYTDRSKSKRSAKSFKKSSSKKPA